MIETQISILINRKSDAELIKKCFHKCKIQFPVYLFEHEEHLEAIMKSDYEEWELDIEILKALPEYEFTQSLGKGRKEIRIQISRYQSEFCTDDWGRPIENPLNETKYLVRKSKNKLDRFNPRVTVLFEEYEQNYFVNIVGGINKTTEEEGFLLLDNFRNRDEKRESEILKDRLYKTPIEAFKFAHLKMEEMVNDDFKEYLKNKKKQISKQQRIPRKKVRDFIKACNEKKLSGILQNLDENFRFIKKVKGKTEYECKGIKEFTNYVKSKNQDLCNKNFKIRTSWNINLPFSIKIGVKYLPDIENTDKMTLKYRDYTFEFEDDKIKSVIEEK